MPSIFNQFSNIKVDFRISDKDSIVKENPDLVVFDDQLHSDKVFYIDSKKAGLKGDGMFTDKPGIKLAVRTADCLPVLFYNHSAGVIGVVHAGWRGTEKQVLRKAVKKVIDQFKAQIKDFYFYFGPAAQNCCYERDFLQKNKEQLLELGIGEGHIEVSDVCTVHNTDYPSHTREQKGRQNVLISIIEKLR